MVNITNIEIIRYKNPELKVHVYNSNLLNKGYYMSVLSLNLLNVPLNTNNLIEAKNKVTNTLKIELSDRIKINKNYLNKLEKIS